MKAVIFACAMSFVSLAILLSSSWLISFDNAQYMTNQNTSSVLKAVMANHENEEIELEQFMKEFEERFKINCLKDYEYIIKVNGYRNNPNYINMSIKAINRTRLNSMDIIINKTLLEGIKDE